MIYATTGMYFTFSHLIEIFSSFITSIATGLLCADLYC